mmetsp:Transcript_5082/g.7770  ORF Transcript_5082/g.7770 Transcript_5082/m.7770 type:complete len:183 (+) Transcript_5082:39-587(+)
MASDLSDTEEIPNIEAYSNSFAELLSEAESHAYRLIRESATAPKDAYEHWQAFSSAVDWTEPWIRCLLGFHLLVFTVAVLTRRNINVQMALFLFITVLVSTSEYLNSYCAGNWRQFSRQNYFDSHGVFAGIMFAGPLLTIVLLQLVNLLALTASALVSAKKLELQKKKQSAISSTATAKKSN